MLVQEDHIPTASLTSTSQKTENYFDDTVSVKSSFHYAMQNGIRIEVYYKEKKYVKTEK